MKFTTVGLLLAFVGPAQGQLMFNDDGSRRGGLVPTLPGGVPWIPAPAPDTTRMRVEESNRRTMEQWNNQMNPPYVRIAPNDGYPLSPPALPPRRRY